MILNRLIYSLLLCAMLTVACPVRGEDTVSVARGPYPFLNLEANRIEFNGDTWLNVGVAYLHHSHLRVTRQ